MKRMKRMKSVKKGKTFGSRYRKFLLILVILCVIAFAAEWVVLKRFQGETETKTEEKPWVGSQKCFEDHVESLNADFWTDLWFSEHPECLDSRDDVKSIMEERLAPENVTYARAKDYTQDNPVYVLENEDGALVSVSVEKIGDGDWKVKNTSFRMTGEKSATVTAPSGCTILCNGVELGTEYCTEEKEVFDLKNYSEILNNPNNLLSWEVSGQLTEPEFEIVCPDGTELSEDKDGTPVLILTENSDQYTQMAMKFFDLFNKYGLYGYYDIQANADAAAALCEENSQAYNAIYSAFSELNLAPCHSVYTTEKTVSPVTLWADNAFSIDVTYDTETVYHGDEYDYFSGAYRIIMVDTGNGYKVHGVLNRSSEQ